MFAAKLRGSYQDFPYTPHIHSLPIINIPHQGDLFVTVNEPTLMYHYHSKSIVHTTVHFGCCTLYVLGQMHKDMYPPLNYRVIALP